MYRLILDHKIVSITYETNLNVVEQIENIRYLMQLTFKMLLLISQTHFNIASELIPKESNNNVSRQSLVRFFRRETRKAGIRFADSSKAFVTVWIQALLYKFETK